MNNKQATIRNAMIGIFRGVEKVTGKNNAVTALQYSTTPAECRQWLMTVQAMFKDRDGKLNKKAYCKSLNAVIENMQFTIAELKKDIEYARKTGDVDRIPGDQVLIQRYEENIGIIADEVRKHGGRPSTKEE